MAVDMISIISLIGICLTFVIQVFQVAGQGHFKSQCCGIQIEHDEEPEKQQSININVDVSHDSST